MGLDRGKIFKTIDALSEVLGSSEGQSTEEIKDDLRSERIDVDAVLSRLKQNQKRISMAARRLVLDRARKDRLNFQNKENEFLGKFRDWSRDKIIQRIKELSEIKGLHVDIAFRELESIGDEEIEFLLEDLEMAYQRKKHTEDDNG